MSILSNLISVLQSQGVFDYYLPFLLTFSVFYALLIKSKIFGSQQPGPKISVVVALVAGIYVTMFSPAGVTLSQFFATFFAQSTVFLTLIVVVVITLGALAIPIILGDEGLSGFFADKNAKLILAAVVILVCLALFASSLQKIPGFPGLNIPGLSLSSDDIALILLLVATGLIIFWAQRGEDRETIEAKEYYKRAKEEAKKQQEAAKKQQQKD